MPSLKHDIRSALRPSNIYGFKGEDVEIISNRGNVVVVKGPTCARFSVMLSELDGLPADLEESPPLEEYQPKVKPKAPAKKASTAGSNKPIPPTNQQSLF